MSASLPLATIALLALVSVDCASRSAAPPTAGRDSAEPAPNGSYPLESVDGRPLPAHVRVPRDSMRGVATPAGMDVVAGAIWFPRDGGAHLMLRLRLLDCGPAASTPDTTGTADCRPTPREPAVGGPVPFTYKAARITIRWPMSSSGAAEVAEGTVRGDTITLDVPFRRVYGPGRRDATWTQRFSFVRVPAVDGRPAPPNGPLKP